MYDARKTQAKAASSAAGAGGGGTVGVLAAVALAGLREREMLPWPAEHDLVVAGALVGLLSSVGAGLWRAWTDWRKHG